MTLIEAGEIFDYWRDRPPSHHMLQILAALWGWKQPSGARSRETPSAPVATPAAAATAALANVPGNQAAASIYDGFSQHGNNPGRTEMHRRLLAALAEAEAIRARVRP
jgi:hypothetical protein